MTLRRYRNDEAPSIDRDAAARLLRAARRAARDGDDESIEWAFWDLPDNVAARRMKVDQLIAHSDYEAAEALIAQSLLRRPTDPSWALRRAQVLTETGKLDDAARELRLALIKRPTHTGTLRLAARVALARGDNDAAVDYAERLVAERNVDSDCVMYTETLLAAGRVGEARRALASCQDVDPVIEARLLGAEGRHRDAADLLLDHVSSRDTTATKATVLVAIEMLESCGDLPRLHQLLNQIDPADHAVLVRAGLAQLWCGSFRSAIVALWRLRCDEQHAGDAIGIALVAAVMSGLDGLADGLLRRLRGCEHTDRALLAEAWSRGLMGKLIAAERSPVTAGGPGADPPIGPLAELLRRAAGQLETAREHAADDGDRAAQVTLETLVADAANLQKRLSRPENRVPTVPLEVGAVS